MRRNYLSYLKSLKHNLFYILLTLYYSVCDLGNTVVHQLEIQLVIQGKGNRYFIYNHFYLNPSEVIVNGEIKNSCSKYCYFDYYLNNVTLKFDDIINTCENMFRELDNIIEIDLSNFDFSKIKVWIQCFIIVKIWKEYHLGKLIHL